MSCTFVTQQEVRLLLEIEKYTNEKMTEFEIKEEDALENMNNISKVKRAMKLVNKINILYILKI